ncbi:MAG: Uncharacterized MFS-type transporter [uncultured Rubrobacteraceae bacterium]|uniref:Uncharacterized MFS-type transporter n=1 Tax=uncultured Rubrobacteraceae bacterium TaxID=349277 RepID=A0A6J4SIX8_9ACTN|nr:MAG: Uncharacterized MFS-type transporter [uncultured Rubrobacteraceae bacterium]
MGAAASILTMAALGWTSDRMGRKAFLVLSGGVFGLGISGLAVSGGYAALLVTLVVLYSASGLYDVGINSAAVDLEQATGRRFMPLVHAAFSAGATVGAVGAGVLVQAGADYRLVYLGLLAPLGLLLLGFAVARFPAGDGAGGAGGGAHYRLYRHLPILLVGGIATLGLGSEGEMEHWSGIYLRDTLGLPALLGGSGVAVFYAAMAVGRLGTAGAVRLLGNRTTLLLAGLSTAAGMSLALATREPVLVVGGFLIVGLSLAAVAPIAFSMAGDVAPGGTGAAVSVVTTLGYGGFLLGPVIVGGLAELAGLRTALLTIVAAGLVIAALALRFSTAGGRSKPASR